MPRPNLIWNGISIIVGPKSWQALTLCLFIHDSDLVMRGSALTVAILALASVIVVATAVPCQQMSLIRRTRTSVAYDIGPGTVSVYPYADGRIYAENHMMWNMSMLVERNRSSLNVDGSSRVPTCSNPSGGHSVAVLDPLAPNVDGQPCPGTSGSTVCGVVASFLLVRDMDCAVEEVTEPFHGYTRDSIYVTMTHPQYPDFKLVAGHHLLNGTVEVYPLPNATWVVNRYQYVGRPFWILAFPPWTCTTL